MLKLYMLKVWKAQKPLPKEILNLYPKKLDFLPVLTLKKYE